MNYEIRENKHDKLKSFNILPFKGYGLCCSPLNLSGCWDFFNQSNTVKEKPCCFLILGLKK